MMNKHGVASARASQSGMTILEVLIVLTITAMVAALATPRLLETYGRAKLQSAAVQIQNLATAIQLYYLDVGQLPSEADGLAVLVSPPTGMQNWLGPYTTPEALKDPWGRDWIYQQPGEDKPFAIRSYGRDGQEGGTSEDADISS